MPKYAGNVESLQPKTNAIHEGILSGIHSGIETYKNEKKIQNARKVVADPKASAIDKAIALASIGQEKLGVEIFKKDANQSTLSGIEQRLRQNLGIETPAASEPSNITMGDQTQETTAQPGAEGTGSPSQPGFTPGAPQAAARNATALNQPALNAAPPMRQPAPMMANAPQGEPQQVNPEQQAGAYEQAAQEAARAGNHPVATQYANKAKEIRKDVRAERDFLFKEAQAQKQFEQKQEFEVRKANEKYRQDLLKGIPATKKLEGQLNKLENLNKKDLLTPAAVKALNFFGVPLGVFDTADEQEFEKQALDLTANIQQDYGSRILQSEFNTYLRRIPTLLNSKEGRTRIIENMRIYKDAKEAEQRSYTDLYKLQKQSGIQHPIVTQEEVMEYADKELNQIFSKLNDNLMEDTGTKEKAKLLPPVKQGVVRMSKGGRFYDFPADQVESRRIEGFAAL